MAKTATSYFVHLCERQPKEHIVAGIIRGVLTGKGLLDKKTKDTGLSILGSAGKAAAQIFPALQYCVVCDETNNKIQDIGRCQLYLEVTPL